MGLHPIPRFSGVIQARAWAYCHTPLRYVAAQTHPEALEGSAVGSGFSRPYRALFMTRLFVLRNEIVTFP